MKTILFFRHGKSDWEADYGNDHERPLKKRGRKAAERMGRFLADAGQVPELVLTSTAVRARETARRAAEAGAWDRPMYEVRGLYEASPDGVLAQIRLADEEIERLMLVGHEPTWSEAVGRLIGQASVRIPTAAVARVDLDVEHWSEAAFGTGTLIWLVPPRLLEG